MLNYPTFLDQDYLRLPTHHKVPLRKDWSLPVNHYYKEPLTINELLTKYNEYGVRLGLFIQRSYHLATLYFRVAETTHYTNLFPATSYTLTENGLYYFLLLKELPPNCLLKNLQGEVLGNFYGSGKLVIGAGSLINNYRYFWVKRAKPYLTFNNLPELLNHLLKLNLTLEVQGSVQFNFAQQEWFCPTKLKARWKARNKFRAFLERKRITKVKLAQKELTKCLDCSQKLKPLNLTNHLLKIHHRKSRNQKRLRACPHCQTNYTTLLKIKEHKEFYCLKYEKPN